MSLRSCGTQFLESPTFSMPSRSASYIIAGTICPVHAIMGYECWCAGAEPIVPKLFWTVLHVFCAVVHLHYSQATLGSVRCCPLLAAPTSWLTQRW